MTEEDSRVEDTGLSQIGDELPELSKLSTQDLPMAVRETAKPLALKQGKAKVSQARSKRPLWRVLWGLGGLGVAGGLSFLVWRQTQFPSQSPVFSSAIPSASNSEIASSPSPSLSPSNLLGHLPYAEAAQSELESIPNHAEISLRKPAAEKFAAMSDAAKEDGILLMPLSGFRSLDEQNQLFFDVKAERGEEAAQRAAVSAPPGYSEHHTGYAVDIGDGDAPSANLQFGFDRTAAFKWLKENAAYYSFEMSFPKNNSMGVSYEPWHWRYVGDRQSLETFYKARNIRGTQSPSSNSSAPETNADQVQ
jgi:zinc D-Ala-D-Ala carboxypeptidase